MTQPPQHPPAAVTHPVESQVRQWCEDTLMQYLHAPLAGTPHQDIKNAHTVKPIPSLNAAGHVLGYFTSDGVEVARFVVGVSARRIPVPAPQAAAAGPGGVVAPYVEPQMMPRSDFTINGRHIVDVHLPTQPAVVWQNGTWGPTMLGDGGYSYAGTVVAGDTVLGPDGLQYTVLRGVTPTNPDVTIHCPANGSTHTFAAPHGQAVQYRRGNIGTAVDQLNNAQLNPQVIR